MYNQPKLQLNPNLSRNRTVLIAAIAIIGLLAVLFFMLLALNPYLASPASLSLDIGRLPLAFIPNQGQAEHAVQFQVHDLNGTLSFGAGEVVVDLPDMGSASPATMRIQFEGANLNTAAIGTDRLGGVVNYILGNEAAAWKTGIPTYSGIIYPQIYPGVALSYEGKIGHLKGTYTLSPGADPAVIRWRHSGASNVTLNPRTGDLMLQLPLKDGSLLNLVEQAPVAWQVIGGQQLAVPVQYALAADGSVGFKIGAYDSTRPLIIDPTLVYGSYLGGANFENVEGLALDAAGNIYLTGSTTSTDFPTESAMDDEKSGYEDVYITKLNPAGDSLIYSTYIGGSEDENANAISVDGDGAAYITGYTDSLNFPTYNAYQDSCNTSFGVCVGDAFVLKLNPDGDGIAYASYLGGSQPEEAMDLGIDASGNVYLIGSTFSDDFPTLDALQASRQGPVDAFVTKIDTTATGEDSLIFSSYLGGGSVDYGAAIEVDDSGQAYLTGQTISTDFPMQNAYQTNLAGGNDLYIAKLNAAGDALLYSTYLGGAKNDYSYGLAIDADGNAYLTGNTESTDFPVVSAFQSETGGNSDVFAAKLNPTGDDLVYSTYLGGSQFDKGNDIAIDADTGEAYVTGETQSSDFPIFGELQMYAGDTDAFVTKLNADGAMIGYSTCLGGAASDHGSAIQVQSTGNVLVAGMTFSDDFPTMDALQDATAGGRDVFVVRIMDDPLPTGMPTEPPPTETPPSDMERPIVHSLTIGEQDVITATDVTVYISATDDVAVDWMYLVEWYIGPESPMQWEVADTSGWVPYNETYPWTLVEGSGTHYIGVWVADHEMNHSLLTSDSLDFASLLLDDTAIDQYGLVPYLVYYPAGEDVTASLTPSTGDADLYVWYPGNFLFPNGMSANPDQEEDSLNFTTPDDGIYIFMALAPEDAVYDLSIEPGGGPRNGVMTTSSGVSGMTTGNQVAGKQETLISEPIFSLIGISPLSSRIDEPAGPYVLFLPHLTE